MQADLFTYGAQMAPLATASARTKRSHPETSHAAARSVTPDTLVKAQRLVFDTLKGRELSDEALVQELCHLKVSESRLRTARAELARAGLVELVGYGETSKGRTCRIWRAV